MIKYSNEFVTTTNFIRISSFLCGNCKTMLIMLANQAKGQRRVWQKVLFFPLENRFFEQENVKTLHDVTRRVLCRRTWKFSTSESHWENPAISLARWVTWVFAGAKLNAYKYFYVFLVYFPFLRSFCSFTILLSHKSSVLFSFLRHQICEHARRSCGEFFLTSQSFCIT